jgi:HEAT repeat protein
MRREIDTKRKKRGDVASRIDAVRSFAGEGGNSLAESVRKYLRDRSPSVRAAALEVVKERKLSEMDAEVTVLLADKNVLVRSCAADCTGTLHEGEAVAARWLYPLLSDSSWLVRVDTLESLAQIGDKSALHLIAERLHDEHPLVRAYAANSIADLDGYEFVGAIEAASQREADPSAGVGFANALLALGDATQFPVLVEYLSSADYRVRCACANAIGAANLNPAQLKVAVAALAHAAQHSLARADRTTMEHIEKELREKLSQAVGE